MKLKEFISVTLDQIINGVEEASSNNKSDTAGY